MKENDLIKSLRYNYIRPHLKNNVIKRTLLIEKIDIDMIDILYFHERLASALRIPKRLLDI